MKSMLRKICILFFPDLTTSKENIPIKTTLKCIFLQKFLRINSGVGWPVHWTSQIREPSKIKRGTRFPGLSLNCYLDGRNGIDIGKNTWIGPHVSLISMNHDVNNYNKFMDSGPIVIGDNCWLAANVTILSGVELGDHTVVAAGAVVTRSFPEGDQMLAGVPAKVIKKLETYNSEEIMTD